MATEIRISDLPTGGDLQAGDYIPVARSGKTLKVQPLGNNAKILVAQDTPDSTIPNSEGMVAGQGLQVDTSTPGVYAFKHNLVAGNGITITNNGDGTTTIALSSS